MKYMWMGFLLAGAVATAGAQQSGQVPQTGSGQQQRQTGGTSSGSMQNGGQSSGSMQQGSEGMQQGNASSMDKKFVEHAMAGSSAEIKLGQMAQQKASSEQVKQFGQKMVEDHTKLNDQMKPIAEQMGVSMTSGVPSEDQGLQAKLDGLSGDAFDKAYMKAMVKDHEKDLKEFKKESKSGKSAAVKDAATQGSQVIQEHLQMAQQVARQVGAVGDNMTNKEGTSATSTPAGPQ